MKTYTIQEINAMPKNIANNVRGSYGDKYSERDYAYFIERARGITSRRKLIQLVEALFDLDLQDAKDMVD